jgi:hypothetical protein
LEDLESPTWSTVAGQLYIYFDGGPSWLPTFQESTLGWQIEPDVTQVLNFRFGELSSKLPETCIFWPEEYIIPTWEKYSTSGWGMP